jgi:cellulose synthase/poly-beta-1,6-N-acetylglucosamine synthase-like glycosyltransferase
MTGSILNIALIIILVFASLTVGYLLLLSIAGKFFYRNRFTKGGPTKTNRIAVMVPAYREDGIIISTAQALMQLDYPQNAFDIYIIADSFQPATISQLEKLPVHVLEVSFEKSTKTKSLNEAFRRITQSYDIALICDADNILARDFLNRINQAFVNGARAVQGRRVAKNLDTSFAILDACSEGINNNVFRKGANAIGLSSSVIGSGMAFEFATVKEVLAGISAVGGFDKILQLEIIRQGNKIHYLSDALVFDEKVDSHQAFQQQRKRWVSSQFIYLRKFFRPALRELMKGNFSYFDLAVIKNLILPRAFLLLILPLLVIASFFATGYLLAWSVIVLLAYILSLVFALPAELVNRQLFQALLNLPRAVMAMVMTLFHLRKANKSFIHTVHTKTEINNPLFHEHSK